MLTKTLSMIAGLWVHPKFPWLTCSPDGLMGTGGLIENKSLKLDWHQYGDAKLMLIPQAMLIQYRIGDEYFRQ